MAASAPHTHWGCREASRSRRLSPARGVCLQYGVHRLSLCKTAATSVLYRPDIAGESEQLCAAAKYAFDTANVQAVADVQLNNGQPAPRVVLLQQPLGDSSSSDSSSQKTALAAVRRHVQRGLDTSDLLDGGSSTSTSKPDYERLAADVANGTASMLGLSVIYNTMAEPGQQSFRQHSEGQVLWGAAAVLDLLCGTSGSAKLLSFGWCPESVMMRYLQHVNNRAAALVQKAQLQQLQQQPQPSTATAPAAPVAAAQGINSAVDVMELLDTDEDEEQDAGDIAIVRELCGGKGGQWDWGELLRALEVKQEQKKQQQESAEQKQESAEQKQGSAEQKQE